MNTRKKFDPEFKKLAVDLSHHRDDIGKLAEELEISRELLYRWQIFRFIKNHRTMFPIEKMCQVLKVSRSAYYAWVSDLTYIHTYQGWLYLTVIIDLWDRKVVGWPLNRSLKAKDTVIPAWLMVVKNRPVTQELIFHSDRGIQYACNEFRSLVDTFNLVKRSMSRKGNCWDNAVIESFFKNLKMK